MSDHDRSNAYNQGIAHLAFAAGGKPFCGRKAHISVAVSDAHTWGRICARCQSRLNDMNARAAKKAPLVVDVTEAIRRIEAMKAATCCD
jgi:hypothetical protein